MITTKNNLFAVFIALGLSLILSFHTSCKKQELPPQGENDIYLFYKAFSPQQLTVKKGTTVTFTNRANGNHTITSNIGLFKSGKLKTDQSYSYTFDEVGTYYFYCNYHSSELRENGVITVQ